MKPLPVLLATFSLISIVPAHAQVRPPSGGVFRLAPANAGTGPYDISSIFGATEYGNGPIRLQLQTARYATDFYTALQNSSIVEAQRQLNFLTKQLDDHGDELAAWKSLIDTLRQSFGRKPLSDVLLQAQKLVNSLLDTIKAAFEVEEGRAEHYRLRALKFGSYWRHSGAYEFESLSLSGPDRLGNSQRKTYAVPFAAESALVSTNQPLVAASARFQGGIAFGNPDHWVSAVSFASFLSPYALDAEANLSLRLEAAPADNPTISAVAKPLESLEVTAAQTARKRGLLDHMRPGDLWAFGSVRSIWIPGSSPYVGGNMMEGAFTYALRNKGLVNDSDQNPIAATTLSVSGIYCAQHVLRVDELGFEARTPVGSREWDTPVFISGRYGTRGNFTLSLEGRF